MPVKVCLYIFENVFKEEKSAATEHYVSASSISEVLKSNACLYERLPDFRLLVAEAFSCNLFLCICLKGSLVSFFGVGDSIVLTQHLLLLGLVSGIAGIAFEITWTACML